MPGIGLLVHKDLRREGQRRRKPGAGAALSSAAHPAIRIELPLSAVGMEYVAHRKPAKMPDWIREAVAMAKGYGVYVEFSAVDATRAEKDFLALCIDAAVESGADAVTVCDSAAKLLPDDFAAAIGEIAAHVSVPVGVRCDNRTGLAAAQAILAVRAGVSVVKTCVGGDTVPLVTFADLLKNCGNDYDITSSIRYTELHRTAEQIEWVIGHNTQKDRAPGVRDIDGGEGLRLDAKDGREVVAGAVAKLGYDLSDEDMTRVYEEFCRVADKKTVGEKELDAIVASVALQVPPTYRLKSYVINNGNIISSSAQITLTKDERELTGICIGDGPIDAAFRALEQIIGHHYELDDFEIHAVTEGKEAVGSALIRLRSGGKLYAGNGISTDVIGAAIRAYIGAVNKIVYEEAEV